MSVNTCNMKCNVTVIFVFQSSEVEGRLSALEAQLGSVVCVLDRLSVLEERMEERDQHRNTDKVYFCYIFIPLLYMFPLQDRQQSNTTLLLHPPFPFIMFFQDEEQVIMISRESWENLMSRLLLLETKVDLNNIQVVYML